MSPQAVVLAQTIALARSYCHNTQNRLALLYIYAKIILKQIMQI
jgi:hypothetical protein